MDFIRKHPALTLACVLAALCALVWFLVYTQESKRAGVVTFAVLNIGQGDALFIQGPTGIQLLVDAGPNTGAVLRELPKVMPFGDRTLDAVVETHPDADHMGGLIDVLERYEVGAFITPGITSKTNTLIEALNKKVDGERAAIYVARRGMVLDLGGGAYLEVLYPDIDVANFGNKSNEGSVVARLVYGKTRVLLTGDIGTATEGRLLAIGPSSLASDILKVGHHGSKGSTGDAFLQAVGPQVALVSVGAKNTYGHPAPDVLTRLSKASTSVMRTDQDGTVICTLSTESFSCN